MSGLSRTPGKRVWVYPHRGFESRPLRQKSSKQAPFQAFFCFYLPILLPIHIAIGLDLVGLQQTVYLSTGGRPRKDRDVELLVVRTLGTLFPTMLNHAQCTLATRMPPKKMAGDSPLAFLAPDSKASL